MIETFAIFIFLHGCIHLLGFVKAFGWAKIEQLDMPISKGMGMLWLTAFILHATTSVFIQFGFNGWWLTGIFAVILSIFLILTSWQYAKFGSLPNLLILIVSILGWADHRFNKAFAENASLIINTYQTFPKDANVSSEMLDSLPEPVKKWMKKINLRGKPVIFNARIRQNCQMRMTPEQSDWTDAIALQYVSTYSPSYIWKVRMNMYPFIDITGRDLFQNGKGDMEINILSLLPVVDVSGDKIDEGSMQRYLAECVWYPSALLSDSIQWRLIDENSAEASMRYMGTKASVTFHFNKEGDLQKVSAMRYQGDDAAAEKKEWIINIYQTDDFNGLTLPSKVDVTWRSNGESWTWLKLTVTSIEYNLGAI
jgi:hypothetical protein